MYKPDTHTCFQDPLDAIKQKFRSHVKSVLTNNFRAKYSETYYKEKMNILKTIDDVDLRERVRHALPAEQSLRSAANAAKKLPTAPKTLENIDLEIVNKDDLNVEDYLLGSSPENGIYLFGTQKLLKEFANSLFKSAD